MIYSKLRLKILILIRTIITLIILIPGSLFSQIIIDDIKFDHLTKNDGLSNSIVYQIFQDSHGAIWIATHDGLNRYNGYTFEIYKNNLKDSLSISDNRISCLAEDDDGNLWIATRYGLNKYIRSSNTFNRYFHDPNDSASLAEDWIYSMLVDSKNRLWIGTRGGGISLYDRINDNFINYNHNPENDSSISHNDIFSIMEDYKGAIWFGTTGKYINKITSNLASFKRFHFNFHNLYNDAAAFGTILFEDSDHNIWIGTEKLGLYKYNQDNNTLIHYSSKNFVKNRTINNDVVTSIIEDDYGNIWISTDGGGMNIYNPKLDRFDYIKYDARIASSPSTNALFGSFKDNNGIIWIGSFNGGINVYDKNKEKFRLYTHLPYNPRSLSYKSVFGLFQDKEERIWVATDGGGLNLFDKDKGTFKHYKHNPDDPKSLPTNVIKAVYEDKRGNFWLGTFLEGLLLFDRNKGVVTRQYKHDVENPNSLAGALVWTILEDKDNNLWIGTLDRGLALFDRDKETFTHFNMEEYKKNGLTTNRIFLIYEDKKGQLWLGTEGGGLISFDKDDLKFISYLHDPDNEKSISHNVVKTIYEDSKGNFWVGTEGGGLNLFDRDTKEFKVYNKNNNLPSDVIQGILEDKQGNLWISTSNGISKFNVAKEKFRNYDISEGLQDNEFAYTVDLKLKTGELLFGGPNGFNIFKPGEISDNPYKPPIELTSFKIFNKEVGIGENKFGEIPLNESVKTTKHITINYKARNISFEFAALNYTLPHKNKYQYTLEHFDDEGQWYDASSTNRVAAYSNLPGGEYIFRVKATNNDGIWNDKEFFVKLEVIPPFWKRLWFRILLIVAIISIGYGYYRYRINSIKRQNEELERKVQIRTSELQLANAELIEQKEEILTQNEEIQQQSEEIMSQRDALEHQNEEIILKNNEILKAYDNMRLLSEFGQKITATLSLDSINDMIYDYVSSLMDTSAFGIGLYDKDKEFIEYFSFFDKGEKIPYFYREISCDNCLSAWAIINKKEVFINDIETELAEYISKPLKNVTSFKPKSIVIIPLIVEDKTIGVISTLSKEVDAYSQNDLTNLKSLASYIAIALDNAWIYKIADQQNRQIKNSIRYAESIQKSILPLQEILDNAFENFVIYKPKDVVSGDFYWYNSFEADEDISFLAVVDCTGHGVPGAFMSLIGYRLLNELIIDKKILNPAEVNKHLDKEIREALRQDKTDNNDGMDVSLICIEKINKVTNTKKILFAGARRPLYIYRAQSKEIELINGTRRSIGGIRSKRSKTAYEYAEVEIYKNDILYLSSDGIVDQNSPHRKKIGTRRLLKTLKEIGHLPLNEQKEKLEELLINHMKKEKQRDDISFIGVRLIKD